MVLAMLLGGLRSAEVRGLKLADVDMGRRRLRVIGKGGKERHVPADQAFFIELAAYLRLERPPGLATAECFVCYAARPPGRRSPRRDYAACSAATARHPGRSGSGRTACGTPTFGTELERRGVASDATFREKCEDTRRALQLPRHSQRAPSCEPETDYEVSAIEQQVKEQQEANGKQADERRRSQAARVTAWFASQD